MSPSHPKVIKQVDKNATGALSERIVNPSSRKHASNSSNRNIFANGFKKNGRMNN